MSKRVVFHPYMKRAIFWENSIEITGIREGPPSSLRDSCVWHNLSKISVSRSYEIIDACSKSICEQGLPLSDVVVTGTCDLLADSHGGMGWRGGGGVRSHARIHYDDMS